MKNSLGLLLLAVFLLPASSFAQGSLTPPGPPEPTMKTLDEIDAKLDKRTDIATVPGDGTALHVITQAGSYYLNANLNGVSGKVGIRVESGDVTLDLNGFSLQGGSFSSDGVAIVGSAKNVRVFNGSIRNWDTGIRSTALGNSAFGHLRFSGNRGVGLLAGGLGNIVTNCVATTNAGVGFQLGENSAISDCAASGNTGGGIVADRGSRVVRCNAASGGGHGIRVASRSFVFENDCRDNATSGVFADGSDNRIESNLCSGNGNGIRVTGAFNLIIRNSASTNPTLDAVANGTNYNIGPNNYVGKIATPPGNSSATNTGLGADAASPWANFSF
jgi:parallel beta-helix repeat protein